MKNGRTRAVAGVMSMILATCSPFVLEGTMSKTKKVAGKFDLGFDCFAYGNPEDPTTWKLPLYIPSNAGLTRNMIKNAVERFTTAKIPDERRAEVWQLIAGACKAHGIKVGSQPSAAARPEPVERLDTGDAESKAARAMAALKAERLVEQIGNWWER